MWSRTPRVPLLVFLAVLAAPSLWLLDAAFATAAGVTALAALITMAVWNRAAAWPATITFDEWRERVGSRDAAQGCTSITVILAALVPAWIAGWEIAGWLEFSVIVLQALTAIVIALAYYVVVLLCFAFTVDTRPALVPEHLRAGLANSPRATGDGAVDPREVAPGFVADLGPSDAAPVPEGAAAAIASVAPLRRVLRLPTVAPWKPASKRRLERDWSTVLGASFTAGLVGMFVTIAAGAVLRAWVGTSLAVLALLVVIAAAGLRASRWEWPDEVSLADWFKSERNLVAIQQSWTKTANALVIGSGLVIAGEAVWKTSEARHDLLCGGPIVLLGAAIAFPLLWVATFRGTIGQPPAVRAVPEPIRRAVLTIATRREQLVTRTADSEEISVVEELAGVPVVPDSATTPAGGSPAASAPGVGEDGAVSRESQERILAELSRAATLRADGAQLVRRVERRLALAAPQPDDTDLLVEVAEVLFLAFPDRAEPLVSALGDLLAGPPAPKT